MNAITGALTGLDQERARQRIRSWIWLGWFALATAGVMSLLLAVARTPYLKDLLPGTDFFHVALVVHVDLSVLVWFIACAGITWTFFGSHDSGKGSASFALAVVGAVMIALAPFVGAEQPLMNNYVPVLQHIWFYLALSALGASLVIQAITYLKFVQIDFARSNYTDMVRFGLAMGALASLVCVACFIWAYLVIPEAITGQYYFELLFWGGGHVLQIANTLFVLIAWLLLAQASGNLSWLNPRIGMWALAGIAAPLVAVPYLYSPGVDTDTSILGFTALMRWGGLAAIPLIVIVLLGFLSRRAPDQTPLRGALICSLGLFAAGGLLGFMIQGSNTIIPAHYHGCIVGVTLAFMGLIYWVLPSLGNPIAHTRLARWQPYVYASGQLMHITGLAMSGGYGAVRKVAGADQVLDGFTQTLGMALMGLGGLLAATGGLLFLVITASALRSNHQRWHWLVPEISP